MTKKHGERTKSERERTILRTSRVFQGEEMKKSPASQSRHQVRQVRQVQCQDKNRRVFLASVECAIFSDLVPFWRFVARPGLEVHRECKFGGSWRPKLEVRRADVVKLILEGHRADIVKLILEGRRADIVKLILEGRRQACFGGSSSSLEGRRSSSTSPNLEVRRADFIKLMLEGRRLPFWRVVGRCRVWRHVAASVQARVRAVVAVRGGGRAAVAVRGGGRAAVAAM